MIFVRPRTFAAVLAVSMTMSLAALTGAAAQDSTGTLHYKGVTLTPVGFVAAEGVWRQRNITADIGSSFNAVPFSGTTNGNLTEVRLTGRQSRIGMMATGQSGSTKFTGYWESDFLGVGTSSNNNESNSYVLRVRQFWGSVGMANGWTLSAGQMWSLVTNNKSGMAPRSEAAPLTIEAQYAAGFNWARQAGLRLVKKIGDEATFGIALEGAQTTFSARNAPANFVIGQAGGSTLNSTTTYSTDYSPDLIVKLAFDPAGVGHFELKAIGSQLRDRVVDPATPGASRNLVTTAYGVGAGAYIPIMTSTATGDVQVSVTGARQNAAARSLLDINISVLYGKGIGRYGTSQLPDATIANDTSLAAITSAQALIGLEAHPTRNFDLYGYVGAEYADRTSYVNAAGAGVGYGSALNNLSGCQTEAAPSNPTTPNSGTCQADTRALWQANLGFWYRFYKGAAGTVQWGMQYSYTSKNTWSGANGLQPQAIDNMIFSSFRYVLP